MPTILREDGFRFFFFSNEPKFKPPHIHVQYGRGRAVFWLKPVSLSKNRGLNASELVKARDIVLKYNELFEEKYNEFFSAETK